MIPEQHTLPQESVFGRVGRFAAHPGPAELMPGRWCFYVWVGAFFEKPVDFVKKILSKNGLTNHYKCICNDL